MGELQIADGVVTAQDGGEAFLLDTGTRRYYRLNPAGAAVWQAIQTDTDPLAALAARYPTVERAELARDVVAICVTLTEAGLLLRVATG